MPKPRKLNLKERLRRSASRLDDVTLDRAWKSALRGDMDAVDSIFDRVAVHQAVDDTISWKDGSHFLFGRKPFKRD